MVSPLTRGHCPRLWVNADENVTRIVNLLTLLHVALEPFLKTMTYNPQNVLTLDDVLARYKSHPLTPGGHNYQPDYFTDAASSSIDAPEYQAAQEQARAWKAEVLDLMDKNNLDVIMSVFLRNLRSIADMAAISVPLGIYGPEEPTDIYEGTVMRGPNIP